MPSRFPNLSRLARYPAPVRLSIFVIALLLLWLPLAGPIYWRWGSGNTVAIVTLVLLYGEFVALLWWWDRRVWHIARPFSSHGLARTRKNGQDLLRGLSIGLLSLLCLFVVEGWLGWLTWQASTQLPKVALEGLGVALGVSFAEELLFRGWLLDELQQDYGAKAALGASSTVYALLHFIKPLAEILRTLPSFPGLLLLGLTLGWARRRSASPPFRASTLVPHNGRLGLSIGLHAGLVWGYYIIDTTDIVRYTGVVPAWVTGIDQNPLAGGTGLVFLGLLALGVLKSSVLRHP